MGNKALYEGYHYWKASKVHCHRAVGAELVYVIFAGIQVDVLAILVVTIRTPQPCGSLLLRSSVIMKAAGSRILSSFFLSL